MKLLRVHVISADTCGGLLDGLDLWLRSPLSDDPAFDPLCFVGPNGTGKSQFLQVLAEMFQSVFHACISSEERVEGNPRLQFELEYLIRPEPEEEYVHILISRKASGRHRPALVIQRKKGYEWELCKLDASETHKLLPRKIVGYTSGDNETLSLPFLISRSGYAADVRTKALKEATSNQFVRDTRLMLIDYGTNLEILVANLLMGDDEQREALLKDSKLKDLHSFRCIVQLAHGPINRLARSKTSKRKGIQLTTELEDYLDKLQRCATCYTYDDNDEIYIFDYWINEQTKAAFRTFWKNAFDLYSAFHKISMLNDLAIPRAARLRFQRDAETRSFASRLPEPQDEDKVFRFERVSFVSRTDGEVVDYVSLSDGEHQLEQLLGTFCMLSFPNVLFLLDEPESHFNPLWRVKFVSRILDMPMGDGLHRKDAFTYEQECLLTTHAPFVPSDMRREKIFIFSKGDGTIKYRNPDIETFGTTFDTIIEECFGVRPPISDVPRKEIETLMKSMDPEEIKSGLDRLGHSVEKVFLVDRLQQLTNKDEV